MENFTLLGPLAAQLHLEFEKMFYWLLPVFFMLALVVDWFRHPQGSPDFLETIKRAFIATLLLVSFQEIAETILTITSGIADKISDLSGLDTYIHAASEKAKSYTFSPTSLLLGFNDLVVALLSFASYVILYFARYITVAVYHFMWLFLYILSPILILFNLFRGTSQITVGLFKSMVEVACYKIVWAILSVMIISLSLGDTMSADGNYLTVVILNFVIALAMLGTPLIVKSLVGGGLSAMSETLGMGAAVGMLAAPAKAASAVAMSRAAITSPKVFAGHMMSQAKEKLTYRLPTPPTANHAQIAAQKFDKANQKLL